MDTNLEDWPHPISVTTEGDERAYLKNVRWDGSARLRFDISPCGTGTIGLHLGSQCVSRSWTWLDGNQCPAGTNAVGPAWCGAGFESREPDEYVWAVSQSVANCFDSAASFEGFAAFRESDGTHVLWVTDPERGSEVFEIWAGGHRERLLRKVPAKGGRLPHCYEIVVPEGEDVFEVVEREGDLVTSGGGTRPFRRSDAPPENLQDLRRLNDVVAAWADFHPAAVPPDSARRPAKPMVQYPADLVLYSSRADFLEATNPVQWYLQYRGWACQTYLGSSDPEEARAVFQAVYETNVAQHYRHLPLCIVVGEANEGDHPERNIVGTFYVPDDDDQCWWSSCASDMELTSFYGDGPECPFGRVVACTLDELQHSVASTLEYYEQVNAQPAKVLAVAGDLDNMCNVVDPPRLLVDQVRSMYEAHGVPVVQRNESSYPCYDYDARWAAFCDDVNGGLTEIVGTGRISNRSILPGHFCQKIIHPLCLMSAFPKKQRLLCELPGCGMADADRANPDYYPSLAKMFLTSDPDSGTSAVAWFSHSRGGTEIFHHALAEEYFAERLDYQEHWVLQELYWSVLRHLWDGQLSMRPFLREAMAFGFPVWMPGLAMPVEEGPKPELALSLTSAPNPARKVTLQYVLPGLARVQLSVFDVTGRLIRTLVPSGTVVVPGEHGALWDGRDGNGSRAPGGLYFARLEAEGVGVRIQKVVLLP